MFLFEEKMFHSRDIDVCIFVKSTDFKICDVYPYFFWILSTIKMTLGQILLCCMTNISNMCLDQFWRLGTSNRLFYNFIKMTTKQDLTIFNSWHLPILNVTYSTFQKNETLELRHNWLLSNWSSLLNQIGPRT